MKQMSNQVFCQEYEAAYQEWRMFLQYANQSKHLPVYNVPFFTGDGIWVYFMQGTERIWLNLAGITMWHKEFDQLAVRIYFCDHTSYALNCDIRVLYNHLKTAAYFLDYGRELFPCIPVETKEWQEQNPKLWTYLKNKNYHLRGNPKRLSELGERLNCRTCCKYLVEKQKKIEENMKEDEY